MTLHYIVNKKHNFSLKKSQPEFKEIFQVWREYENIAMHFNELLIKLRVQALGAIAIIGTISTALLKESAELPKYLFP
ncbi:hypothetical protein [Aliterella atlantica]|nr:hypothetical protein [Aliterella atlantica]